VTTKRNTNEPSWIQTVAKMIPLDLTKLLYPVHITNRVYHFYGVNLCYTDVTIFGIRIIRIQRNHNYLRYGKRRTDGPRTPA
jgi:hypothetical protein